jgi:signal transduction histidine kinase
LACPDDLHVLADPERLGQILLNLLSNAVKFTPDAGRVDVRACVSDGDPQRVRVDVSDSGRGIAPEDIDRIFQAFVQVDPGIPGQGAEQGLGLGLAISRDLAQRMGGEIRVRSIPGRGSTFTLTLPRSRSVAATALQLRPGRTSRADRAPRL